MPQQSTSDVALVASAPEWSACGEALATELYEALAPTVRHVEHIGSTAVPKMAAKPVFDLQASVRSLAEAQDVLTPLLAERGFVLTPYTQDHVPAGSGDTPARWTKLLWTRRGHRDPDVNLHVRVAGSPNERFALIFRDWLRAHPEAVPAYAHFKQVLAGAVPDLATYADVKDPIVDLIVAVAEPWARATGWRVGDVLTPR